MELIKSFQAHDNYVIDLIFTPNGTNLISCGMDAKIKFWDTNSWKSINAFEKHKKSLNSLSLSNDGVILATASTDLKTQIWNIAEGILLSK